jgi:hypothetical protein
MLNHINERSNNIRETGYAHAVAGLPAKPVYAGQELGQLESFMYYEGYVDGNPEFKNKAGTIIEIEKLDYKHNEVYSNVLGWTFHDLPVFPYPQVVTDNSDIVWGPPGSHTKIGE